ncbi:hypothetical protein ACVWWK_007681 [Bradyrhizobium sp. LB9.1b]
MPPIFSEVRFSFSFFLTTPAKNPRTECCCQSVAFMTAAIVVPLGLPRSVRTAACFEEAVGFFIALEAGGLARRWADVTGLGIFAAVRFRGEVDNFDFCIGFRVVIGLSSSAAAKHSCH